MQTFNEGTQKDGILYDNDGKTLSRKKRSNLGTDKGLEDTNDKMMNSSMASDSDFETQESTVDIG